VTVVEHLLLLVLDINAQNALILIFVKNAKLLLNMSMSSLRLKRKEHGIKRDHTLKTTLDLTKDNLVITVIIMATEDSGEDLNIEKRKEVGN